ncbi:hypothetical protein F5887DRAFT_916039 [Amanita rubescens]|nr:hypothetical protein F5887DRAFT_916039 [Amanita rubescens]
MDRAGFCLDRWACLLRQEDLGRFPSAVRMLVLVGNPFKTDVSNLQMLDPSHFTQTLEQERKYYRDAKENEKKPKSPLRRLPAEHARNSGEADLDPLDAVHHLPSANNHPEAVVAINHLSLLAPPTNTHDPGADAPRRGRDSSPSNQGFRSGHGRGYGQSSRSRSPAPRRNGASSYRQRSPYSPYRSRYGSQSTSRGRQRGFSPSGRVETEATAKIPLAVVDKEDLPSVEAVETNLTAKDHHEEDIPPDGGGGVRRYWAQLLVTNVGKRRCMNVE